MSWSIACLKSDIEVTPEFEADIKKLNNDRDGYLSLETYKGKIYFDSDAMEHMDCVNDDDVLAIFKKHKVNGDIFFGSVEGDNAGEFWGYRFKDGEMTRMEGVLAWSEL